jgi:hypothetical protein
MQENSQTEYSHPIRDRDFEEVEGGYYDHNGNYLTPNGSFWDENQNYFNRDGFDKFGGIYDEYGTYIPGPDWNEELGCYNAVLINGNANNQVFQQALHETVKGELLDEYHYYQNFFQPDENLENLVSLEVPTNPEFPLKEEYTYTCNINNISSQQTINTRSPIPTPSKKVDTIVLDKSPFH